MSYESEVDSTSVTSVDHLSSKIYNLFKHYEAPILSFQRLLVWEDAIYSSIFVAISHVFFYYLFLRSNHFFGVLFFVLLILIWVDCWKHKIWPEIRAVAPDADSEWGELNPRLLSVKEMCDVLASVVIFILSTYNKVLHARRANPGKFCLCVCIFCLILMYIGGKIHGAFIMYLVMLCGLIWPVVWYHRILENTYTQIEPFLMQLQYTLQQRPGNTYQIAQSLLGQSANVVETNDNDIEEFVPVLDGKTAAVLAKAITDESELSETDEEILARELPSLSRASTPSTDEQEDELFRFPKKLANAPEADFGSEPAAFFRNVGNSLPLPPSVVADVGNVIKESLSAFAQSLQKESSASDSVPNASHNSTPISEYEFVVVDPDSEAENS